MILALSTQQAIGGVIAFIVTAGMVVYIVINWRAGKPELGSEIELAANRKRYYDDAELEGKVLDRSLGTALILLTIVAVGLPLYWLAEPGRQEGNQNGWDNRFASRGEESFEERCSSCHGSGGGGGAAQGIALTSPAGEFVAQVDWAAPALTTVLTRFSEEEVTSILNYGRAGVMPAWGLPGGGPLTTQQIEELIYYLREIQTEDPQEIRDDVTSGVETEIRSIILDEGDADIVIPTDAPFLAELQAANRALAQAQAQPASATRAADIEEAEAAVTAVASTYSDDIQALIDDTMSTIDQPENIELYGRLLFNNPASAGAYSCARCHTNGWSYGARSEASTAALIREWPQLLETGRLDGFVPGGGIVGPSLEDGATVEHFPESDQQQAFIATGSNFGVPYGIGRNGTGGMPGFGPHASEDFNDDDGVPVVWNEIYTEDQIAAIVAYERSL